MHEDEIPESQRYSAHAEHIMAALDERVNMVLNDVKEAPFWQRAFASDMTPQLLQRISREVFLSIHWYQPHTTEAGFHMLGRLPKKEVMLLKASMLHKVEEAEHGEWALRDYLSLGGDKAIAARPPSPPTLAVAAVWWRMATVEDPFGYFGAEYLFEALTALVTQLLVDLFKAHKLEKQGLDFIFEHATEDVKHAKLFRHLVCDSVTKYPESGEAMLRCFDYFRQVYPIPVWSEAFGRALASE